jgi:hypothetical protein
MKRHSSPFIKGTFLTISLSSLLFALSCSKNTETVNNNSQTPTATSSSSGDFEGTIAINVKGDDNRNMQMTYFLKGKQTRIETAVPDAPEGSAVMLWDNEGGKITTLMPSRKIYMTVDMKQAADDIKETKKSHGEEDTEFPKLTRTGRQETIAGHVCEHWLMGDKQELDLCIAKGLGYFGMGGKTGGGLGSWNDLVFGPKMLARAASHPEWAQFLEGGAFPLKLTAVSDGKVMMSMEATRIERKPLDSSIFSIPPDYKEMNVPNVPGIPSGRR